MQQCGVIVTICFATFFGLGGFICAYLWVLERRKRVKAERSRKWKRERENLQQARTDGVIQLQKQEIDDLQKDVERLNEETQRLKAKVDQLDEKFKQLEEQLRVKEKKPEGRKDGESKEKEKEEKEKKEREKKPKAPLAQPKEPAGKQQGKKPGE